MDENSTATVSPSEVTTPQDEGGSNKVLAIVIGVLVGIPMVLILCVVVRTLNPIDRFTKRIKQQKSDQDAKKIKRFQKRSSGGIKTPSSGNSVAPLVEGGGIRTISEGDNGMVTNYDAYGEYYNYGDQCWEYGEQDYDYSQYDAQGYGYDEEYGDQAVPAPPELGYDEDENGTNEEPEMVGIKNEGRRKKEKKKKSKKGKSKKEAVKNDDDVFPEEKQEIEDSEKKSAEENNPEEEKADRKKKKKKKKKEKE